MPFLRSSLVKAWQRSEFVIFVPCSLGEPAFPLPWPLPIGYAVDVCPNGTKRRQGERAIQPVPFRFEAQVPERYQYLFRAGQHVRLCEELQQQHPEAQVRLVGVAGSSFSVPETRGFWGCRWR